MRNAFMNASDPHEEPGDGTDTPPRSHGNKRAYPMALTTLCVGGEGGSGHRKGLAWGRRALTDRKGRGTFPPQFGDSVSSKGGMPSIGLTVNLTELNLKSPRRQASRYTCEGLFRLGYTLGNPVRIVFE